MAKRKKRRLEDKLTRLVDGEGRSMAESLISEELRNVAQDLSELISKAISEQSSEDPKLINSMSLNTVMKKWELDKESRKKVSEILQTLIDFNKPVSEGQKRAKKAAKRAAKKKVNRLDLCCLANLSGVASRYRTKITKLLGQVQDGIRAPWDVEHGSATQSSDNRKYVPAIPKNKTSERELRWMAKRLSGKSLKDKCLMVIEERLMSMPDGKRELDEYRKLLGSNTVRLTNAVHDNLKDIVDFTVDMVKHSPTTSARELNDIVQSRLLAPLSKMGPAAKVASRAVVSSTLNLAIMDEVERLVTIGVVPNSAFLLNKPAFLYKAVMDSRTSDICRDLNGKIIPLADKMRLARYLPPQHANCRSVLIPNFRPLKK